MGGGLRRSRGGEGGEGGRGGRVGREDGERWGGGGEWVQDNFASGFNGPSLWESAKTRYVQASARASMCSLNPKP